MSLNPILRLAACVSCPVRLHHNDVAVSPNVSYYFNLLRFNLGLSRKVRVDELSLPKAEFKRYHDGE